MYNNRNQLIKSNLIVNITSGITFDGISIYLVELNFRNLNVLKRHFSLKDDMSWFSKLFVVCAELVVHNCVYAQNLQ